MGKKISKLRLSGLQYENLRRVLFPGDGLESVALVLCGRAETKDTFTLTARRIVHIPVMAYRFRSSVRVEWQTEWMMAILQIAEKEGLSILKIHSHPSGLRGFSSTNDKSDKNLFDSLFGWIDSATAHASAIMVPSGEIIGRIFHTDGKIIPIETISVAGTDLQFFSSIPPARRKNADFAARHVQVFGRGTFEKLRSLSIAIIGVSGTGSIVAEQLARLGVGKLILVDPDHVEIKNLNRIPNATMEDALANTSKVKVIERAINKMGLGTIVVAINNDLFDVETVKTVSEADILFGCMDSIDGRYLLNRLAIFYVIPYFDLGIKLSADGQGGVEQICGTVHYLQPGGSSLLSRGVFTLEAAHAAALKRTSPEKFEELLREKYIIGVQEDSPAVISVNMQIASMAVNEFLARIHGFRDDGNESYAINRISLTQCEYYNEPDGGACSELSRHVGRGDTSPLLGITLLS